MLVPKTKFMLASCMIVHQVSLQNEIVGLFLVEYFAPHVMCRKLASYKSVGCFLGRNLNPTVSVGQVQETYFLHFNLGALSLWLSFLFSSDSKTEPTPILISRLVTLTRAHCNSQHSRLSYTCSEPKQPSLPENNLLQNESSVF